MTHEEFQRRFEQESGNLYDRFMRMPEGELLQLIANKQDTRYKIWQGNDNYQVWRALGDKGTAQSLPALFAIVGNLKNPYLIRYHACSALFKIAGISDEDFQGQVQYGLDANRQKVDQPAAIERLRVLLGLPPLPPESDNAPPAPPTPPKPEGPWWKVW